MSRDTEIPIYLPAFLGSLKWHIIGVGQYRQKDLYLEKFPDFLKIVSFFEAEIIACDFNHNFYDLFSLNFNQSFSSDIQHVTYSFRDHIRKPPSADHWTPGGLKFSSVQDNPVDDN